MNYFSLGTSKMNVYFSKQVYSCRDVGVANAQSLWILSRTPTLDEGVVKRLEQKAKSMGIRSNKQVKTKQTDCE